MKKINKILVPTDFSGSAVSAFRYALWFADKYKAQLDLLHIVSPELVPMDVPVMSAKVTRERVEAATEVMQAFVDSTLVQVQTAHSLEHVPVIHKSIEVGISMNLVSQIARREDADLIIMGTRGEHGGLIRFFGSTATSTISSAPCPVLVIPENTHTEKIQTIAYGTDLTESDPYHIWELGMMLTPFHPILRVVHIKKGANEDKPLNMQDLEDFFAERSPSIQITFHDLVGKDSIAELEEFAENFEIDMFAMYKPHRNFLEKLFHSSMTKRTALSTDVPLLVIK